MFSYFNSKKSYNQLNNITKSINISVINGEIKNLDKEDETIIYKSLINKKRKILLDLDNAIELYSIKHIINKKDKFAEVEYCCKICLENPINVAMVPCGHLFCYECYSKSNCTCYNCRTKISDILKVYS